jgi:hypothetical protein
MANSVVQCDPARDNRDQFLLRSLMPAGDGARSETFWINGTIRFMRLGRLIVKTLTLIDRVQAPDYYRVVSENVSVGWDPGVAS